MTASFETMDLKKNLLRGIYSYGFEHPSVIQSTTIPIIIKGSDLIAQSQSGTGKTGAFLIGVLNKINEDMNVCQAIVVAHTRELAQQICDVCRYLGNYMNVNPVLCIGGQDIRQTRNELSRGPSIVVGTPGRIIDLINRRFLYVRTISILVLDEADEILSSSFQPQMRAIIESLPRITQKCLFSATYCQDMINITNKFMNQPEKILIQPENLTLDGIKQFYIDVEKEQWKFETFCDLFSMISVSQTMVYVNTIRRAEELRQRLIDKNFTVCMINSTMNSSVRLQIMKDFRSGSARILISTDLLSRGIDIQQVSIVINYDLPRDKACYLHRIGRTGRFGRKGVAINFITKYDDRLFYELKRYYDIEIDSMPENIQQYLN